MSLTDDPCEEIAAAKEILDSLHLSKSRGMDIVSCPTCGRTKIDLIGLAKTVEKRLEDFNKPLTIAVMGCAVNGPGEAKHADYGIAGGIKEGYIFKKGEIIKRLPEDKLVDEFINLIHMENV